MVANGAGMNQRMPWEAESAARAILKEWCALQEKRYGPDWKEKLAAGLAKASEPYVDAILKLGRK